MKCNFLILLTAAVLALCLLPGCGATPPAPTPDDPPDTVSAVFNVADYYNADGSFSALALALPETDSGRDLTAVRGNRFIAGDNEYTVDTDSFTFVFYSHPSVESAVEWWRDYFETAADNGIVSKR